MKRGVQRIITVGTCPRPWDFFYLWFLYTTKTILPQKEKIIFDSAWKIRNLPIFLFRNEVQLYNDLSQLKISPRYHNLGHHNALQKKKNPVYIL